MGTEVLRPQDLLGGERFHAPPFHRRRNNGNHLANLVANNNYKSNQRKLNSNYYRKTSPRSDKRKPTDNNNNKNKPTSPKGQVTILRRGESLDSLTSKINGGGRTGSTSPKPKSPVQKPVDDLAVCGTGRIGPEMPEMVPKQIRLVSKSAPLDTYAGTAFSLSPSPRSLPLPSFFSRKNDNGSDSENEATKNLRRLLRLD